MGIENRDYLRDGQSSMHFGGGGPSRSDATITQRILVISVIVFLAQWLTVNAGQSVVTKWLRLDPRDVLYSGQIWRLLTYGFCHDLQEIFHIIFNMMMFWLFARRLEQRYGRREFLMFYLCAIVFAGIANMVFGVFSNDWAPMIGASGGVMAVMTLYALHWPHERVMIWGIFPVEVRWLVVFAIFMDVYPMLNAVEGDRIAHMAHLGGVAFGFLYLKLGMRLERILQGGLIGKARTARAQRKSGLRVFNPESKPRQNIEEEMDRILAKVHENGADSLSKKERAILNEASRKIRERK